MGDSFRSVFAPGLFDGKIVLVTGGGTGIGRCVAHELAALGAQVVIAARRREPLDRTAQEIAVSGGRCDAAQIDIRDEASVVAAVASIVERHGRIDGLVNNAGGQFVSPVADMSLKGWRSVIDLNLNGTFLVSQVVYRDAMKEQGGAIVNMLADIWTGYPWMAHMAAARAGIENLSRTLSYEWAPDGIRVNCVAPGVILSSGMHNYPEEVQRLSVAGARSIPASRLGTESEVSAAIVFLLSPAASYITGDTIKIDGGARFQKGRFVEAGQHRASRPWNGFHLRPDLAGTPFEETE